MSSNSTTSIVAWASEPDGRGTMGLLWSCFATIFLCTWNAIHPNLPARGESKTRIWLRRMRSVLACLLAPEWFVLSSVWNLADAMRIKRETPGWSLAKCNFLQMGGFVIQSDFDDTQHQRVSPKKLFSMFKTGALPWPECTDDEIEDRSKADWLVKTIGLIQIFWFITQTIGRWAQGLAVTTLEIFTLGIVICAAITFLASWTKPFDVQVPIVIHTKTSISISDCIDRVRLDGENVVRPAPTWTYIAGLATFLVFSGIHIAAWNFHFSSLAEQVLWKVSSIGCTILAFLFFAFAIDRIPKLLETTIIFTGLMLYTLFRVYMFVEMFASLRAVPASVYQTPQWSQYFPALG